MRFCYYKIGENFYWSLLNDESPQMTNPPILQPSIMILANSPFRGKQTVKVFFCGINSKNFLFVKSLSLYCNTLGRSVMIILVSI